MTLLPSSDRAFQSQVATRDGMQNTQWLGPFGSAEDAYARVSNRADARYCAFCRPQD